MALEQAPVFPQFSVHLTFCRIFWMLSKMFSNSLSAHRKTSFSSTPNRNIQWVHCHRQRLAYDKLHPLNTSRTTQKHTKSKLRKKTRIKNQKRKEYNVNKNVSLFRFNIETYRNNSYQKCHTFTFCAEHVFHFECLSS